MAGFGVLLALARRWLPPIVSAEAVVGTQPCRLGGGGGAAWRWPPDPPAPPIRRAPCRVALPALVPAPSPRRFPRRRSPRGRPRRRSSRADLGRRAEEQYPWRVRGLPQGLSAGPLQRPRPGTPGRPGATAAAPGAAAAATTAGTDASEDVPAVAAASATAAATATTQVQAQGQGPRKRQRRRRVAAASAESRRRAANGAARRKADVDRSGRGRRAATGVATVGAGSGQASATLRWSRRHQPPRAAAVTDCIDEAKRGNARCQVILGSAYRNGTGVTRDPVEASRWYRKAAEQGSDVGQYELGLLYESGLGVPKDAIQAVGWFRKAADQGLAGRRTGSAWPTRTAAPGRLTSSWQPTGTARRSIRDTPPRRQSRPPLPAGPRRFQGHGQGRRAAAEGSRPRRAERDGPARRDVSAGRRQAPGFGAGDAPVPRRPGDSGADVASSRDRAGRAGGEV